MNLKEKDLFSRPGIDELRSAVNVFNHCNEGFNQRFTSEQLLLLYRAFTQCGHEITPDEWSEHQVKDALKGIIPRWPDLDPPCVIRTAPIDVVALATLVNMFKPIATLHEANQQARFTMWSDTVKPLTDWLDFHGIAWAHYPPTNTGLPHSIR